MDYRPIDNGEVPDHNSAATSSYIAGAIYFACFAGCLARAVCLHIKGKQPKEDRYEFES